MSNSEASSALAPTTIISQTTEAPAVQGTDASSDNPASQSNKTLCGVCETNQSKYKCSRCYLPYCSVACNKIHRENHPADPDPLPKRPSSVPQPPITDIHGNDNKSDSPFQILENSEQLQFLFHKYPRLRAQLLDIHAATMEPSSAQSRIPASLLKSLPNRADGWNPEKGIENGKEALRKARKTKGEDGEAIREYTELVLHLMEKSNARVNG